MMVLVVEKLPGPQIVTSLRKELQPSKEMLG